MPYRLSAQFLTDANGRRLADAAGPRIEAAARYYRARDHVAAAQVCDAILEQEPEHFDAMHLRGVLYLDTQKPEEALDYLRRAEPLHPDDPQLWFHIGNALLALRRYDEAVEACRRSLVLRPDDVDTLNNLGNALSNSLRYEEAIACFRQALAIRPDAPPVRYNLGRAFAAVDRLEEAVDSFRAALTLIRPDTEPARLIDLHNSLGEVLIQLGRYDEALDVCRLAPAAIADAPSIRWNESLTLLMLGDYAEGWRKYECRFLVPEHDPPRAGAAAVDLAAVAGQRVLVFPEQGRGDMIQFARYLPLLAAHGAHVVVEMYPELKPLFETIDGVTHVVTPDDAMPDHDRLTPLLSLPLAFGTVLGNIPAQVPYLRAPDAYKTRWAERLGPRTRRRIGIVWWGAQHIPRRSMRLATLAPVLELPGLEFHALQKDIPQPDRNWLLPSSAPKPDTPRHPLLSHCVFAVHDAGEAVRGAEESNSSAPGTTHPLVTDHSAALEDFADTAALIGHMDLVISIDTSVAHLAGALGVPVWIMLASSPDWRWLRDRDDSPWYPSARLFRQARRGDWDDVVRRVAAALSIERFKYQIEGDQHGVVAADQ